MHVFDNYFLQMYAFFKPYTSNINEMVYLFRFLYPRYTIKFEHLKAIGQNVKEIVERPGAIVDLFDTTFKGHLREVQQQLYMHVTSGGDIEKEVAMKKEEESLE
jgi:hypothetical protein